MVADAADGVFSPNGTRLAFTRVHDGVSSIWVSNRNGSAALQISVGRTADWQPISDARLWASGRPGAGRAVRFRSQES